MGDHYTVKDTRKFGRRIDLDPVHLSLMFSRDKKMLFLRAFLLLFLQYQFISLPAFDITLYKIYENNKNWIVDIFYCT